MRYELETLAEYLMRGRQNDERRSWQGELRSGARANLLMGVVSTHVEIKAACARAERMIERYTEPLQALHSDAWPNRALALCWRRLAENGAHDTICACSADQVITQALARFVEVEELGRALMLEALERLAETAPQAISGATDPSVGGVRGSVVGSAAVVVSQPAAGRGRRPRDVPRCLQRFRAG